VGGFDLEHLEVVKFFLFGDVKFLHLLLLLMALDIITGVFKSIKSQSLWSRKSLFGYARKILVLVVIILANVIDQILGLSGAVTYATVIFYIANEGLSIIENLAVVGVLVPKGIAEKLNAIESRKSFPEEVGEEMTGKKVDENLKREGK
jgi:toxin secretion/phage lysis holin